jgi:hypothetical protein
MCSACATELALQRTAARKTRRVSTHAARAATPRSHALDVVQLEQRAVRGGDLRLALLQLPLRRFRLLLRQRNLALRSNQVRAHAVHQRLLGGQLEAARRSRAARRLARRERAEAMRKMGHGKRATRPVGVASAAWCAGRARRARVRAQGLGAVAVECGAAALRLRRRVQADSGGAVQRHGNRNRAGLRRRRKRHVSQRALARNTHVSWLSFLAASSSSSLAAASVPSGAAPAAPAAPPGAAAAFAAPPPATCAPRRTTHARAHVSSVQARLAARVGPPRARTRCRALFSRHARFGRPPDCTCTA